MYDLVSPTNLILAAPATAKYDKLLTIFTVLIITEDNDNNNK